MTVLEDAKRLQPHLTALRRELHRYPETSMNERETAARIVKELEEIGGYGIRCGISGGYGILAELSGAKPGKLVALRADMDALSVTEETGLPYASEHPGVMHACGHDNHMAMLLGAARLLRERQSEIRGGVRLIFQPAEENAPVGGAAGMIAGGALEGVDAVFGMHVWPNLPLGKLGVRDGAQMAASDHYYIRIEGAPSHGAQPHQGTDALIAGAQFVSAVQTIISRNRDPLQAAVLTIGVFHAGSRYNIVPGSCEMEGTCRSYDPALRALCERRLRELLDGICAAYGCKGTLTYERGYSALRNDAAMAAYMRRTQEKLFGTGSALQPENPAMTAEDFSFYAEQVPAAFGWIGTTPEGDKVWPLHSSRYAPDEDVLWRGAACFAQLVLDFESEETQKEAISCGAAGMRCAHEGFFRPEQSSAESRAEGGADGGENS
ncbi:MAG: M20 metallopeptidase family protein [Stomatobaculum sp.]